LSPTWSLAPISSSQSYICSATWCSADSTKAREELGWEPDCDRLERKQLIDRHVSSESRRDVTVDVSVAGSKLLAAVTERRRSEIETIMHAMDVGQRERLIEAFETFATAAGGLPDNAWKLGWS